MRATTELDVVGEQQRRHAEALGSATKPCASEAAFRAGRNDVVAEARLAAVGAIGSVAEASSLPGRTGRRRERPVFDHAASAAARTWSLSGAAVKADLNPVADRDGAPRSTIASTAGADYSSSAATGAERGAAGAAHLDRAVGDLRQDHGFDESLFQVRIRDRTRESAQRAVFAPLLPAREIGHRVPIWMALVHKVVAGLAEKDQVREGSALVVLHVGIEAVAWASIADVRDLAVDEGFARPEDDDRTIAPGEVAPSV
jgi:hypothetical protein